MNETVNKIFFTEDKFMYEMHFREPPFTSGACITFTKHC